MPEEGTISEDQGTPAATENQPSEIDIKLQEAEERWDKRLRGLQGAKDKEIADLNSRLVETAKAREVLEQQMMELVNDPEAKATMKSEHLQARLRQYEQRDAVAQQLNNARLWFVNTGFPEGIFKDANTAEEMQEAAENFIKGNVKLAKEATRTESLKQAESKGVDDVVMTSGPSPASRPPVDIEFAKAVAELKETKGLKSDEKSRRFLALERKFRTKGVTRQRPKV